MLRAVLPHTDQILAGLSGLAGVDAALVEPEGAVAWSSPDRDVLPPGQGRLPCLALAGRHGRVANPVLRGHSCCQGCPAVGCRLVAVVPVAGVVAAAPPAGALVLAWQGADNPGEEAAGALLTLAGGLAAAITACLTAEADRQETYRHLVQFEALANTLAAPVLLVSAAGQVLRANLSAETLFGRRLIGAPAGELFADGGTAWGGTRPRQIHLKVAGSGERVHVAVTPLAFAGQSDGALLVCRLPDRETGRVEPRPGPLLYRFDDIRGVSGAIAEVKAMAERASVTDATVLIRGESGTGKEVFAQAIHGSSQRRQGPFVAVNCAAIPESLLESELFGYDEGAFTGARKGGKPGKFELAHGGSLFLDEVGDMPLLLQAKLLRILQERVIERIGGSAPRPVDVRIIAATNRDLAALIRNGQFREDLYYRLNVIPLHIPPLRERKEDLYLLIDHFLRKYGRLLGKEGCRLAADVMNALHAHSWPGNVRELENTVQYMVSLEQGSVVTSASLPPHLRRTVAEPAAPAAPAGQGAGGSGNPGQGAARHSRAGGPVREPARVRELLRRHGTSTAGKRAVARDLGISLATLYRWLQVLESDENSHPQY